MYRYLVVQSSAPSSYPTQRNDETLKVHNTLFSSKPNTLSFYTATLFLTQLSPFLQSVHKVRDAPADLINRKAHMVVHWHFPRVPRLSR
jgi:hypothetical protein